MVSRHSLKIIQKISLDYHDKEVKKVAKGLKVGDRTSILKASNYLKKFVSMNDVLIPIPDSTGRQGHAFLLSYEIHKATKAQVYIGLRSKNHMSSYIAKKKGIKLMGEDYQFHLTYNIPKGSSYWLVDNVISTGQTILFAKRAIPYRTKELIYAADYKNIQAQINSPNLNRQKMNF